MSKATQSPETDESTHKPTADDSETASSTSAPADDEATTRLYQCPFCDAAYTHEYFTRVHVTLGEDDVHRNWNGLMPEVEIDVVTPDGDHIETVAREVRTADLASLTRANVPDDYTTKQTTAILGAAKSPHFDSLRELTTQLEAEHDDPDLIPSRSTANKAIDEFFDPMTDTPEADQLAELTPLQQVIVLIQVHAPELTDIETSDRVDCSDTHVWNVRNSHSALIEVISNKYEAGESLETIITEALSPADIGAIKQAGYADALPIELSALDTTAVKNDTPAMASTTDGDDGTEGETEEGHSARDRGIPSNGSVMSASPDQLLTSSETDAATSQCRLTEAASEDVTTSAVTPEPAEDDDAGEVDPTDATTEATPSDVATPTSEEQSVDTALAELHYAISIGQGMLAAAASGADVQSQAVTFAAKLDAKCAKVRRLRAESE